MSTDQNQDNGDALQELLNLKIMIAFALIFIPLMLGMLSTAVATWSLAHKVLVPASEALLRIPYVKPAVGVDLPRLIIAIGLVIAMIFAVIEYGRFARRARIRRALKELA